MYIILVGTAGAGKSTLASELSTVMEDSDANIALVNFDPAADKLPYDPDVDVRNYVKIEDFLDKGLGPNGSLISAVDSLINYADKIRNEIDKLKPDFTIIDTPGQLELFAYRIGGPLVLNSIIYNEKSVVVFLMDSIFFDNPANIVSILTLASSVNTRFKKPQINIISKSDLLIKEVISEVIPRLHEEGYLESLLMESKDIDGMTLDLSLSLAKALYLSGYFGDIIPVNIFDELSLKELYGKIQDILTEGEDYKIYNKE
ncbi:MAG: ATP/GTP-binding protein [Caldisphaera sp.]|nr:ATP/GTP-binding protein [Caldisphaera sp.]PMP60497.1 MAG: GTPase [Caldisphaera sp.]PMP90512.1 MAG: GTPase [Caldisphaera sp.]